MGQIRGISHELDKYRMSCMYEGTSICRLSYWTYARIGASLHGVRAGRDISEACPVRRDGQVN